MLTGLPGRPPFRVTKAVALAVALLLVILLLLRLVSC
jgi:hypothetical protein